MLDLINAPEGATHYREGSKGIFYKKELNKWYWTRNGINWALSDNTTSSDDLYCSPLWSIHSNTTILRDLSDEQRGLLFNSWVKDKDCIELYIGLMGDFESTKNVIWDSTVIYRVRQKSERELFIDEWSSKIATAEYKNEDIRQVVGEMFDIKLEL